MIGQEQNRLIFQSWYFLSLIDVQHQLSSSVGVNPFSLLELLKLNAIDASPSPSCYVC
jgi:hypothetical protein